MRITSLPAEQYVRDVLPHSAAMWSANRSYDDYVGDFLAVSASGFGKRRFRTLGCVLDGALVTSCKRYQRELRCHEHVFRAAGIGAVFTPEAHRGRGYATAFLGALLDAERAAGTDFVYLFSDIHPAFYERLGFVRLPARAITLRADALSGARIATRSLDDDAWPAMERCFTAHEALRPFALTRPPLLWEWIRFQARERSDATSVRLAVLRGRRVAAYVRGRRYPAADSFTLDECAFVDDDAAALLPALIRNAAGDLRRVTGWLPPAPVRTALPHGAVRARTTGITMMIPLSAAARGAWQRVCGGVASAADDPVWNGDHV